MDAKYIALLLAILLAISVYFNVKCDWGSEEPGELTWPKDTISMEEFLNSKYQLSLCAYDQTGKAYCMPDSLGMRGFAVQAEKLALIIGYPSNPPVKYVCFSYEFTQGTLPGPGSGGRSGQLTTKYCGASWDEANQVLRTITPAFSSDMTCPNYCPN
jgi:hypothetical protein